jgi:hypothetical protein
VWGPIKMQKETETSFAALAQTIAASFSENDTSEDALLAAVRATPDEALGNDILALAADDVILASLIKQYLNVSRNHKSLLKRHGQIDPIVDVMADMVDSAWCAIQTRLIELGDRKKAGGGMAACQPRAVETKLETRQAANMQRKVEPKKNEDFVLFLMWLALMWPQMKQNSFNLSAGAFARASA